ncbi:DUF6057 family protein [uncultured Parabacteroides sp.]|uniref:DUF6057 family protein n=1 Tax=uncultured Parabacteroides sp. TaxID=512312 RepID=UPI0025936925|nr:DUF6057 family protein [uncultured Parabacteroides sp.]
MKGRTLVFWLFVFAGLWFFFCSFGTSTFQRQEEVQLFIPEWVVIRDMLSVPGGFCAVVGQALVQYYTSSLFVLWVNSAFLCVIGFLCYLLLQEIAPRGYNLLLALFPVLGLVKAHTSPFYVLDGTVGLLLLLFFSFVFIRIRRPKVQLFYGVASVVLIYGLAGQLAALYGLVVVFMSLLCRREKWYGSFAVFLIGVLLTYIGIRLATGIPLIDGIYSERYQESQLQPDSYVYFIWIRFVVLLLTLLVAAFAMKFLPRGKRSVGVAVTGSLLVVLFCFSAFCLPGPYEVRNNRMNELSVWEQRNEWDTIIREHPEKEVTDYVSLNYLNMALAQKGLLGDRLFHYDQKGPQSLLASWDRTYYMSCLLSDLHYMIGDISLSEGYAMEGLTLAKRGGSPRMLQRLVKISLIRRDFALADKYLDILGRLPGYRRWAEKYAGYVLHPERIGRDEELAVKTVPAFRPDNLLCLIDIDSLWSGHLSEPGVNRVAWEYVGCSYLLAKEMEKFKTFLSRAGTFVQGRSLPIHFQEAALVLAVEDLSVLDRVAVRSEIVQRYKQFQKDILKLKNSSDGLSWLYQQYGDTFWFYYYCKKLNG